MILGGIDRDRDRILRKRLKAETVGRRGRSALRAVSRLPGAGLEPSLDGDRRALAERLGRSLGDASQATMSRNCATLESLVASLMRHT